VASKPKSLLFRKSMYGLYIGALMFLSVILIGATTYWLEGWKLSDAIYMVIITVFSVGYEEVEPVSTTALRVITMLIIVAGDASKVYFVGSLVQFITEGEIGKAMDEHRKSRDIETITDHAIICGYGRIGQTLGRELVSKNFPFLIVDNNADRVALAHSHGFQALVGDAGDENTLAEAHIERAVVLATVLPNDMVNVFITLTARNMRPNLRIIARAEDPTNEKKLQQAGANEIILPAFVGGMQIANSITHPTMDSILKAGAGHIKSLQQLLKGIETGCMVLGVKKPDGTLLQHPPATYRLEAHDTVIVLSHGRLI
jgi:voltage-gated potassium channel